MVFSPSPPTGNIGQGRGGLFFTSNNLPPRPPPIQTSPFRACVRPHQLPLCPQLPNSKFSIKIETPWSAIVLPLLLLCAVVGGMSPTSTPCRCICIVSNLVEGSWRSPSAGGHASAKWNISARKRRGSKWGASASETCIHKNGTAVPFSRPLLCSRLQLFATRHRTKTFSRQRIFLAQTPVPVVNRRLSPIKYGSCASYAGVSAYAPRSFIPFPQPESHPIMSPRTLKSYLIGLFSLFASSALLSAAGFSSDFNGGLPAGTSVAGTAAWSPNGGVGD